MHRPICHVWLAIAVEGIDALCNSTRRLHRSSFITESFRVGMIEFGRSESFNRMQQCARRGADAGRAHRAFLSFVVQGFVSPARLSRCSSRTRDAI